MSKEFAAAAYTVGQLNAMIKLIKRQCGEDGPERLLRRELVVSEPFHWRMKDRIIYFSVTSDGTTGEEWIARLEAKRGRELDDDAKAVLNHKDFQPSSGVTTEIAVFPGTFFSNFERTTKGISFKTRHESMFTPNHEVACLIYEKFTIRDIEAMGLWDIVVMHEPVKIMSYHMLLKVNGEREKDNTVLSTHIDTPHSIWGTGHGFAFVISQSSF